VTFIVNSPLASSAGDNCGPIIEKLTDGFPFKKGFSPDVFACAPFARGIKNKKKKIINGIICNRRVFFKIKYDFIME
jgi:hypothetical protein